MFQENVVAKRLKEGVCNSATTRCMADGEEISAMRVVTDGLAEVSSGRPRAAATVGWMAVVFASMTVPGLEWCFFWPVTVDASHRLFPSVK